MSFNHVPSKVEVMGWNPHSLAGYMKKLKLSGCDKVVMRNAISGAEFMKMTERDLQVFSAFHLPMITKIQSDINKEEQRKASGHRSKAQKSPKQVFVQEEEVWDSDEFDNESDNNYESPEQEEDDEDYLCAPPGPGAFEEQDRNEGCEDDFRPPSSADKSRLLQSLRAIKPQGSHSRDPFCYPPPAERTSKAPALHLPRMNPFPQKPFKNQASPPIDRKNKPGRHSSAHTDRPKSKGAATKAAGSSTGKLPQPRTPNPRELSTRASMVMVDDSTPGPQQGLDPSWYRGDMTRHQAEVTLRGMNKDGAFVVRDSTKGSAEHPYTLMLLKQGKVYNIKIRSKGDSYSLGTGLKKNKSFPGVEEMITHHTHTPLLVIDAADQGSEAQIQCCLLHPAGL